jgi:hypothetical protein
MTKRQPGWDSKTIARIAKAHYGGYPGMFKAHGWPERGAKMMTAAPKRIVAQWGSISEFEAQHTTK